MVHMKSEALWAPHVLGKAHKENLRDLQENLANKKGDTSTRKRENDLLGPAKAGNGHNADNSSPPRKKAKESSLISGYSSDEDMEASDTNSTPKGGSSERLPTALPTSFETTSNKPEQNNANSNSSTTPQGLGKSKQAESLPEGFFDDPVLDAKARNVEYKDPIEEEWEKFRKEIAEETNVSEAIMAEDVEESKVERDIEEIDEQIHNWQRVEQLQQRKEELMMKEASIGDQQETSDSDIEEQQYDEYLSWRAKGVWKV